MLKMDFWTELLVNQSTDMGYVNFISDSLTLYVTKDLKATGSV